MKPIKIVQQQHYDVAPIGAKYINSIRANSYEYKSALAELIDNSQDAGANQVIIDFLAGSKKNKMESIIVADDGSGMTFDELKNSFSLGADRSYDKNGNGKFGMGGTNGCLSMAAIKVTVSKKNGEYNIRKYDLEEVNERDAWGSFIMPNDSEDGEYFISLLDEYLGRMNSKSGSLVFLTDLDRMSNINIKQVSGVLKKQYGKTYYHALYMEALSITVDGETVSYTDPLLWNHELTIQLVDTWIVKPTKYSSGIKLKAVSLYDHPAQTIRNKLSASGGYIFRNHRLIESGIFGGSKWPGLWDQTQNKRDIRWALYFCENSDSVMNLSNSKDSVSPNTDLVDTVVQHLIVWAKHYADIRDNRDKSQTAEESKKDLDLLAAAASVVLKDSSESVQEDDIQKERSGTKKVSVKLAKPKRGVDVIEQECGKYKMPLILELHPDESSDFKHIAKINLENEFIQQYYNNKSAETKEACRTLLLSTAWALYQEKLETISDSICTETLDNVESKISENMRKLTRRQNL